METVHIYLIPGLAANSKIFEHLSFPSNHSIHYLEWLDPYKNESLTHYAGRLSKQIIHPNPILIGVSMGGIIAQELTTLVNARKTIIISSVKSKNEFSPLLKFSKKIKLYKILPFVINQFMEPFIKLYFGKKSVKHLNLYNYYITKRDQNYLKWAIEEVINWERVDINPSVIHIHGNKDEIFPIKYIKNCNIVHNGTHVMVINKAKTLSNLIQKVIENED